MVMHIRRNAFTLVAAVLLMPSASIGGAGGVVTGNGYGHNEIVACNRAKEDARSEALADALRTTGQIKARITRFGRCQCRPPMPLDEHEVGVGGDWNCTVDADYTTD